MAKPRIFVSSTYYDLKHIRSSLELFIESLGFEPVLSEKGDIPYNPDQPLDESCYKEAAAADLFVLVIGGRYGSASSSVETGVSKRFHEQYESITRKEFEAAHDENIPVFILIESGVYAEYQTFLKNRMNDTVEYAHVDSVNVFRFVDSIIGKQRNNPIFQFERSAQIEGWLRDQWAGMFRDLLRSRSQQKHLMALTGQVSDLKSTNETLKKYLEVVLNQVTPETSEKVIHDEKERISDNKRRELLRKNEWFEHLVEYYKYTDGEAIRSIVEPSDRKMLFSLLEEIAKNHKEGEEHMKSAQQTLLEYDDARRDYNSARLIFDLKPISFAGRVGKKK